jgi:putative transposase
MGTSRYVYNETVKYLDSPGTKANWKAIKDACTAVKNAKKKSKQTGQVQKIKFRSRRDKIQSCYIPKSAVSSQGIYHTILGSISLTEKLPDQLGDCRLVSHLGITYLCIPHEMPRELSENQGRVVALDPGVRSFLTLFSEKSFGWLGQYDIGRIQRLCYYLDSLISRSTKAKAKEIIHNLGGRKTIKDSSGVAMGRDLNGGRGIFLRSLVDIPSLKDCIVNVS